MVMRRVDAPCAVLLAAAPLFAAAQASSQPEDAQALELADQPVQVSQAARPWRLYVEGGLARHTLRGAPSDDVLRATLDLRVDTRPLPGLRAVLSDRLDLVRHEADPQERNVNALREAYVSWQARPDVLLDLGRVNVRYGAAWGYNPTDFFRGGALRSVVSPDPPSLRENRQGTVVVQAQKLWSESALSAAYSPELDTTPSDDAYSLDLGSTNFRDRWLLVASHKFSDRLNPQLLLHGGAGMKPQIGLNVSSLLNEATVGYAEIAVGKGRSLAAQALALDDAEQTQRRAAVGFTYTTSFDLSLTAEAEYSTAAPSESEWRVLRAGMQGEHLRVLQVAQREQELPVRHAAFFYATWKNALVRRLDISAFVRHEPVTRSREQWLEARYRLDHADVALQWLQHSGNAESVFGSLPQKRMVEAVVRVYF
jgi:opacity protein-like surface antigen